MGVLRWAVGGLGRFHLQGEHVSEDMREAKEGTMLIRE